MEAAVVVGERLGALGEGAEIEVDDLGSGEGLLTRLLEELVRVDAREPVERLLRDSYVVVNFSQIGRLVDVG